MAGKSQHTVQRFHLAQFAGDQPKGHVWIYNKHSKEPRSADSENVSIENYFYSVEREDGTWDTRLDDLITNIEAKAVPVYRELLAGNIPPYSQPKYDFAQYLAIAYVRTKKMRRMSADTVGQMMQVNYYAHADNSEVFNAHMARYEREKGITLTNDAKDGIRRLFLDPSRFNMVLPKEIGLYGFHIVDDLTDIFLRTHWSLVDAEHGFFITSDHPIVRVIPGPAPARDHGFLHKTMEVSFPLSPRRMLVLTHFKPPKDRWLASRETVDEQNDARAASCEDELYCHIKHKDVAKLCARYKDPKPSRKVFGYGPKQFAEIKVRRRRKRQGEGTQKDRESAS